MGSTEHGTYISKAADAPCPFYETNSGSLVYNDWKRNSYLLKEL